MASLNLYQCPKCGRSFSEMRGRINEPLDELGAPCVSHLTLPGETRRGKGLSLMGDAPELVEPLWERVCELLGAQRSVLGAMTGLELADDRPAGVEV